MQEKMDINQEQNKTASVQKEVDGKQEMAQETTKEENQQDQDSSLQQCEQELQEWKNKCLRVAADFDNYKKRTEKDRVQWQHVIQASMLQEILDIVDNVDRAFSELNKGDEALQTSSSWIKGFELIAKNLKKFLDKHGVKKMAQYATFDPELHEAMMRVQSDDHESGAIVQVLQEGYMLHDRVLRPAKVSVAE